MKKTRASFCCNGQAFNSQRSLSTIAIHWGMLQQVVQDFIGGFSRNNRIEENYHSKKTNGIQEMWKNRIIDKIIAFSRVIVSIAGPLKARLSRMFKSDSYTKQCLHALRYS